MTANAETFCDVDAVARATKIERRCQSKCELKVRRRSIAQRPKPRLKVKHFDTATLQDTEVSCGNDYKSKPHAGADIPAKKRKSGRTGVSANESGKSELILRNKTTAEQSLWTQFVFVASAILSKIDNQLVDGPCGTERDDDSDHHTAPCIDHA